MITLKFAFAEKQMRKVYSRLERMQSQETAPTLLALNPTSLL